MPVIAQAAMRVPNPGFRGRNPAAMGAAIVPPAISMVGIKDHLQAV
ncbi:MAG: hypothetical protein IIB72_03430 [Proteobacteria bacterium]|nr:hypothetical protein [Pseudomonadota bacterium]